MARIAPAEYMPDVAIPPGATIRETLQSIGMTQAELAKRMGRPATKLSEIIHGRKAITVDTAIALGRVLPYPVGFWLDLEQNYRLTLARLKEAEATRRGIQWMRETIPVRELIKRELIPDISDPGDRLQAVLKLFGVGSVSAWEEYWGKRVIAATQFRRSQKQSQHVGRVAAWLRIGELDAQNKPCAPFGKRKFLAALKRIRPVTVQPREVFEPVLDELPQCGVVVSLVKEIPSAGISGATRWCGPSRAHIQLSFRYKTDDHFWFTLFHEAGHILLHDKSQLFLTGKSGATADTLDREADQFARDLLIPPSDATLLSDIRTREQVIAFAARLGIAPGIVAGRLQHDEYVTPQLANYWKVKRKLDWEE